MSRTATCYEQRLARQVLGCEEGAVEAALDLFNRDDPTTLSDAARLVEAHGRLSADAFDRLARAYDIYWHQRGMPCD